MNDCYLLLPLWKSRALYARPRRNLRRRIVLEHDEGLLVLEFLGLQNHFVNTVVNVGMPAGILIQSCQRIHQKVNSERLCVGSRLYLLSPVVRWGPWR